MRASMRTVPWLRESGCRSASSRRAIMSENSIWRCRLSTKPRPSPKSSHSERSHDVGRLVVDAQRNAGFRRIMTAQVELGKRGRQQHGTPVAGNQVGKQRRLGIAQIRAGIGGIDSNRHGPPLKLFAIINASILPAHADRFATTPTDLIALGTEAKRIIQGVSLTR